VSRILVNVNAETPIPEMPKCHFKDFLGFTILGFQYKGPWLLVIRTSGIPNPELPKSQNSHPILSVTCDFGFFPLLCPDHLSSGPPKCRTLKFLKCRKFCSSPSHTIIQFALQEFEQPRVSSTLRTYKPRNAEMISMVQQS
jgi:hypothetical protein